MQHHHFQFSCATTLPPTLWSRCSVRNALNVQKKSGGQDICSSKPDSCILCKCRLTCRERKWLYDGGIYSDYYTSLWNLVGSPLQACTPQAIALRQHRKPDLTLNLIKVPQWNVSILKIETYLHNSSLLVNFSILACQRIKGQKWSYHPCLNFIALAPSKILDW